MAYGLYYFFYFPMLPTQKYGWVSVKNLSLRKGSTLDNVWKALFYGTDFMFKEVSKYKSNIHYIYYTVYPNYYLPQKMGNRSSNSSTKILQDSKNDPILE